MQSGVQIVVPTRIVEQVSGLLSRGAFPEKMESRYRAGALNQAGTGKGQGLYGSKPILGSIIEVRYQCAKVTGCCPQGRSAVTQGLSISC